MHKNIVVFEIEGGSDKYFDGHRKDTMPIVNAIREAGWSAEVVYYRPEWKDDLYDYVSQNFDGYISRVNPGNIPGGERGYFELLTSLSVAGLVGMSTPGEMMAQRTHWSSSRILTWFRLTPLLTTTSRHSTALSRPPCPTASASLSRTVAPPDPASGACASLTKRLLRTLSRAPRCR